MFYTQKNPYRKKLPDNLILRSVETIDDAKRLAEFNGVIHTQGEIAMTELLITEHPHTHPRHWLIICNEDSGDIVSTLCLIPWQFSYHGAIIKSAELGIVGTHKDFRKRGLQRELAARHMQLAREEEFHLSHIQGIPYFYRQFGYDYAVPLELHINIELRTAKASAASEKGKYSNMFKVRPAVTADIPSLEQLYNQSSGKLDLFSIRTPQVWQYILGPSLSTGTAADTYIVEDAKTTAVGYLRISREGFGDGLILQECSEMDQAAYPWVFEFLHNAAIERNKPYIRCNLSERLSAGRWILENGGKKEGQYRWQMKIINAVSFFTAVKAVLNERLAQSDFSSYSGILSIDMFKEAASLTIQDGRITDISNQRTKEAEQVRLPPNLLPVCVLGDRTIGECHEFYPDVSASVRAQHLFSQLFPKMNSFLLELY